MWNEPDIPPMDGSPKKTPAAIAAFNVRTARTIRKNIPDARLAGLSLCATAPEFHEACYKAFGDDVKLFWRFVYHGYVPAPEESYDNVMQLKQLCAKYAPHARMWQGENGAPSEMSGDGLALHRIAWSEVSQAKWDMRRMLGDLGHDVESSVFTLMGGGENKSLLRRGKDKSVVDFKIAYYSVQNVASVFDCTLARRTNALAISTKDETIALYEYRKRGKDQRPVYVFWERGDLRKFSPKT
jgi:hypothetical protein